MYDYQKIINAISCAIDTDELDKIIEYFIESIPGQHIKDIIYELYISIEEELSCENFERIGKMKRAMVLIEVYLT